MKIANMATSGRKEIIDASAIIDMEVMDGDESDYETSLSGSGGRDESRRPRKQAKEESSPAEDIQKKVTENVASYVWQSGSQQAKKAINTYANVDLLRPYFNVEPHEVRQRLLQSLIPKRPSAQQQKVPRELYGPTMLIFTLIALLLFQMKTGGHTVQEGTLMGTAFGTCFGYWLGVSGFVWFLSYVCNAHITMLQILCLLGYALFGHCIVMGLTIMFHTSHDHLFFYLVWAIFGGLSTLRMVSVLMSRTAGQTQRLIVCGAVSALHLCFLLYLHFAYHQMVEDLSEMMQHAGIPQPGMNVPQVAGQQHVGERSAGVPESVDAALKAPPEVAGSKPARQPQTQSPQQQQHAAQAGGGGLANLAGAPKQPTLPGPNQPMAGGGVIKAAESNWKPPVPTPRHPAQPADGKPGAQVNNNGPLDGKRDKMAAAMAGKEIGLGLRANKQLQAKAGAADSKVRLSHNFMANALPNRT